MAQYSSTDFVQRFHDFLPPFMTQLFAVAEFKQAVARGNEYNLYDQAPFLLREHARIMQDDYTPTVEEMLCARLSTKTE